MMSPVDAPLVAIHCGAGGRPPELRDQYERALATALARARAVLDGGGEALDAAQAAVMATEDEADLLNAGRGSVLCADGTVEMAAAVMRGADRGAGAVTGVRRTRHPILAARAVLDSSPHVLLAGAAADAHAAACGLEQRDPSYFVTERQRRRLGEMGSEFEGGTVGAVCQDRSGGLAAATSTGGRRGQARGRVGDSPLPGAGTWADAQVAVSCTGDGEAFIRAGAARLLAALRAGGAELAEAADAALAEVGSLGGAGGLVAIDATGTAALPFSSAAMPRGLWMAGADPRIWV